MDELLTAAMVSSDITKAEWKELCVHFGERSGISGLEVALFLTSLFCLLLLSAFCSFITFLELVTGQTAHEYTHELTLSTLSLCGVSSKTD